MPELRDFDYDHSGIKLRGRLALPDGAGPHPAALVMHDGLGIGSLVQRKAQALAGLGYVALASDMYGAAFRTAAPEVIGAQFMTLQQSPGLLRARAFAAYHALRGHADVDARRIVAIGYCLGGQSVLELARGGADLSAVVSLHGLLTTRQPAQRGAVKPRVLAICGAQDPHAPARDIAALQQELTEAGANWHVTLYGQGWHAFTDPEIGRRSDVPGVRYDPFLDRLSWAATTEFLAASLAA